MSTQRPPPCVSPVKRVSRSRQSSFNSTTSVVLARRPMTSMDTHHAPFEFSSASPYTRHENERAMTVLQSLGRSRGSMHRPAPVNTGTDTVASSPMAKAPKGSPAGADVDERSKSPQHIAPIIRDLQKRSEQFNQIFVINREDAPGGAPEKGGTGNAPPSRNTPGDAHNAKSPSPLSPRRGAQTLEDLDDRLGSAFRPITVPTPRMAMSTTAASRTLQDATVRDVSIKHGSLKRARKDYVTCMLNELRSNNKLYNSFRSHIQDVQTEKRERHTKLSSTDYCQQNMRYVMHPDELVAQKRNRLKLAERKRLEVFEHHHALLQGHMARQEELAFQRDALAQFRTSLPGQWHTIVTAVLITNAWVECLQRKPVGMSPTAMRSGMSEALSPRSPGTTAGLRADQVSDFIKTAILRLDRNETMRRLLRRFRVFRKINALKAIRNGIAAFASRSQTGKVIRTFLQGCRKVQESFRHYCKAQLPRQKLLTVQWERYQAERFAYDRKTCDNVEREMAKAARDAKLERSRLEHSQKSNPSPSPTNKGPASPAAQSPKAMSPKDGAHPGKLPATGAERRGSLVDRRKSQAPGAGSKRRQSILKKEYVFSDKANVAFRKAVEIARGIAEFHMQWLADANTRLGADPPSATAVAFATLNVVNFDRVTARVPPEVRDFLLQYIVEKERIVFAIAMSDYMVHFQHARQKYKELEKIAEVQSTLSEALAEQYRQQLANYAWPQPPRRSRLLTPNEMRVLVLIGYVLVYSEKKMMFERGLEQTSSKDELRKVTDAVYTVSNLEAAFKTAETMVTRVPDINKWFFRPPPYPVEGVQFVRKA